MLTETNIDEQVFQREYQINQIVKFKIFRFN